MALTWPNNEITIAVGVDGTEDYTWGPFLTGQSTGMYFTFVDDGTLTGTIDFYGSANGTSFVQIHQLALSSPITTGYGLDTYAKWIEVRWRYDTGAGNLTVRANYKYNNVQN